jgi:hypothetical protein
VADNQLVSPSRPVDTSRGHLQTISTHYTDMVRFWATTEEAIDLYVEHLASNYPDQVAPFKQRRTQDREAALAEAIVFWTLKSFGVRPKINEVAGTGGADFVCSANLGSPILARREPTPETMFIVEATSLDPDAVSRNTSIPNQVPDENSGGAFSLLTRSVFAKAKDKATQLAGYNMPRVLAIASSHEGIGAVFNSGAALNILVSDYHWRQEIGSTTVDPNRYVDLANSVFMKPGKDGKTIEAARRSISAILLVAVHGDESVVYGILHPEPAKPFPIEFLPKIPFLRIAKWPIPDGKIFTEWVIAHPDGLTVHHPVRLHDKLAPA